MKTMIRPFLCLWLCLYAIVSNAQTPVYNSYPSAQAVIFLDFDGHTVSNTSWNWNGPIYCGPSGLSETAISEIYNRIAEDFRPFTVNVTTDSAKFLAAPLNRRQRIIFTVTSSWYGNVGGVSMVGSFTWGDDTPAFVFTALLGYQCRQIGEAGSHEIGHSLGLYHQVVYDSNCVQVAEYNPGQGNGEIGWAPIMGVGYYRNMTVWHYGPNYTGCNSTQNELRLITTLNHIPFRTDDHASNFKHATIVSTNGSQFAINGVVERDDDEDYFKINVRSDGQFTVNAAPFSAGQNNSGSNLDMQISLYNRSKALLGVYNPGAILNSVIDTFLQSGTYYLKVEGLGNEFTPDYASLGAYTLNGNITSVSRNEAVQLFRDEENGEHQLSWTVPQHMEIEKQVLEYSNDGKRFIVLATFPPHISEYSHRPAGRSEWMYQVRVFYRDGSEQVSNRVIIKTSPREGLPQLISNTVTTELRLNNSSPGCDYYVTDMQGVVRAKGRLPLGVNSISLPFLAPGIYMIRFAKDNEVHTEKFMRQ